MNRNTTCGGLIKQLNDALARRANNPLRKDDLIMTQLGVLLILNETSEGRMNMKELEHALHVAQSTAVGIVKRLEHKGFIESCCNPEDRRIKIVTITKKGTGCCAAAESLIISLSRQGIIFIPALFVLDAVAGMSGIVWAQPVADVLSLVLAAMLYFRIWRKPFNLTT